ncbi:unnamed protein product, partial [Brassica rapa]
MEKITIIFVVLLLISSCKFSKTFEGGFQCNKPEDCDPRGCRVYSHLVCKNRKCTCGQGALIGDLCTGVRDCVRNGCPPNNHVICNRHAGVYEGVCLCIP